MKDLHIKLDNGDNMNLEALQKKYKCTKTDLISSLLEIAYNATCNEKVYKYWMKEEEEELINYMDEFHNELFNAINNRK